MPAYRDDQSAEIAAALGRMPSGSAVSAVATRLLDLFTGGSIAPGTRLPPERQLAATLEVGRSAVREALAALEILGVVDVRPGSGTYLRGSVSELLPQSLSWGMLIGARSTVELAEVRGALEIYAARLAAERMTDEQLARLGEAIERMRASLERSNAGAGDPGPMTGDALGDAVLADGVLADFVEADLAFHQELAASTGNAVLLDLLQIIRSLLRVWVDRAVQEPEQARTALEEHTAVFAAISARDGDAAASAMAHHMVTAATRLTAAVAP